MATIRSYGTETKRLRQYLATLNDVNAKLSYVIQLLREEHELGQHRPNAEELHESGIEDRE